MYIVYHLYTKIDLEDILVERDRIRSNEVSVDFSLNSKVLNSILSVPFLLTENIRFVQSSSRSDVTYSNIKILRVEKNSQKLSKI